MKCSNCPFDLTDQEQLISLNPPMCSICDARRCWYCGEYIPKDQEDKRFRALIHIKCYESIRKQDQELLIKE